MKRSQYKVKIGILGCGAIGSRIAAGVINELRNFCQLSALHDCDHKKANFLAKGLSKPEIKKNSLRDLIQSCDLMVEAVNAQDTRHLIRAALKAKRHVLAMSVGKLLQAQELFALAAENRCQLLIPSGAIAGIDAVKAASLAKITHITLTTRKPLSGFGNNPFIKEQGIDLSQITKETVLFEGDVSTAVRLFPQNINVAATLALASQAESKVLIRILTSPDFTMNTHEIEICGDFGRIITRTENVVCPDNPKTSYLAVLSGIQTLREFCGGIKIGT